MYALLLLFLLNIDGPKTSSPNTPIVLNVDAPSVALIYPSFVPLPIVNKQVTFVPNSEDIYVFVALDNSSYKIFPVNVTANPQNQQIYSFIIFDQTNPIVFDDPTIFDVLKQQNVELRVWPKSNPLIPVMKLDRYLTSFPTIITYNKLGKIYPAPAVFPKTTSDLVTYYKSLK